MRANLLTSDSLSRTQSMLTSREHGYTTDGKYLGKFAIDIFNKGTDFLAINWILIKKLSYKELRPKYRFFNNIFGQTTLSRQHRRSECFMNLIKLQGQKVGTGGDMDGVMTRNFDV